MPSVGVCGRIRRYGIDDGGTFLPPSLFFLKYVGIIVALVGFIYMYFWVYRAGYKKEAILMTIISIAFALIIILALSYYFNLLYGV